MSIFVRISRSVGFKPDGLPALNYPVLKLKLVSMFEFSLRNLLGARIQLNFDGKIEVCFAWLRTFQFLINYTFDKQGLELR